MAVKRILEHEAMETMKRLREEETMADRLTDLPESLQLHILSFLHTRNAIQTVLLSKSWVCSWTCIPVLNFNSFAFGRLYDFDRFVYKVFSLRQSSVKLEKLTFIRFGTCRQRILTILFGYAFSRGVRELEIGIGGKGGDWPIWLHASTDSVTSLKLESTKRDMGCSFLGPRSSLFKNLTNLHLKRAIITDLDPFSRFPALDKLTLIYCSLNTNGNVLNLHALQLSELTISNNTNHQRYELTTPKLRYFEYQWINFPKLTTHQGGLPILETAVLDCKGFCSQNQEKMMFDDVLMLFDALRNAKLLTVFSSVVHLLSLFPDELVNRSSPFKDLKCLKLDFRLFFSQRLFERRSKKRRAFIKLHSGVKGYSEWSEFMKLLPGVKAYFLQNSHDAESTMIYPSR